MGAPIIDTVILPRLSDIGGFEVGRVLPSQRRRSVGPFIFFDQMGPKLLGPGQGLDVRPHPHIGLATLTYLFQGELVHRDSLGSEQAIRPGAVNLMIAGSGIVHSERTAASARTSGGRLFGAQMWLALPAELEDMAPSFSHHGADSLPVLDAEGTRIRVILGAMGDARSPVASPGQPFCADVMLSPGARVTLPDGVEERAAYLLDGVVEIAGAMYQPGQMLVFKPRAPIVIKATNPTRLMLLGGAPLDGPRHIWWNFVSSSKGRIEQAKADWRERRFPELRGESDYIPLPVR